MATLQLFLVVLLIAAVAAFALAVSSGERRRQRPLRMVGSIGEALRQAAELPTGRVLVLFVASEVLPALEQALVALPEHAPEARPGGPLRLVVIRRGGEDEDVAGHLFRKYLEADLPAGPTGLLLDQDGTVLGVGPLPSLDAPGIRAWLDLPPRPPAPAPK